MTERDLTDKDIQTLSSQVNTSHVKYEVIDQESKDRMIADMQRRLHLRTPHSPTGGGGLIDLVAVSPAYDIKKVKCSGFMHITKNGPI